MIKLKLLLISELFLPSKKEFEDAAKKSEYHFISVILDKNGKVYVDDYVSNTELVPRENIKVQLKLDYNQKKVDIYKRYLHGNKLDDSTQKLIEELLKNKIIDTTWKVEFADYEGYYLKGNYQRRMGEFEKMSPNFWSKNTRVGIGENLKLYHGTSTKELPTILKYGLRPLGSKHTDMGGETRMRVKENEKILYLSGTFQDAFRYGQLKARWNMRAQNKVEYGYVEHWEWERWFIKPVVLLVTLPDFTKLRSDDDRIIGMIKNKSYEIWKAMPEDKKKNEQIKSAEWFKQHGIDYIPTDISDYLWTISDNGFQTILPLIDKNEWNNWKASLEQDNQLGYEGIIPSNYIQVLDLYKTVPSK